MAQDKNSSTPRSPRTILLRREDTLPLLRQAIWPLVEVRRPISVRIVSAPILLDQSFEVPYVPTSKGTVKRMLEAKKGEQTLEFTNEKRNSWPWNVKT